MSIQRNRRPRRGGALLEFALCAPILLYLLVGASDFARYYMEASEVGAVASQAARLGSSEAPAVEIETFCACPSQPGVRFSCGEQACGSYGEAARYTQAIAVRPFSFVGRYPGFPRSLQIRRKAGFRTR